MANGWPDGGGDITVNGGSVQLLFDETIYVKSPTDPKKHENATRRITRIVIGNEKANVVFDSGQNLDGLKWTITVHTK